MSRDTNLNRPGPRQHSRLRLLWFQDDFKATFLSKFVASRTGRELDPTIHSGVLRSTSIDGPHSKRRQQMRRLLTRAVVVGLVLYAAAAVPLFAQQGTSEISGRVTDEQGGALPGVS